MRASDSDRERVITLLGEAVSDGRLTLGEHSDRVERAYAARTLGELASLTTDLATPTAQPIRLDTRRSVAGIFSTDRREGHWVVPESVPVLAVFGDVVLDLREALMQSNRTIIYATVIFGTLQLNVPEGVAVDIDGSSVFTRKINRTPRRSVPGQAVVEVRTVGIGGTIRVSSPKKARWLGGRRRNGLPG
jgi:hypothetical protein